MTRSSMVRLVPIILRFMLFIASFRITDSLYASSGNAESASHKLLSLQAVTSNFDMMPWHINQLTLTSGSLVPLNPDRTGEVVVAWQKHIKQLQGHTKAVQFHRNMLVHAAMQQRAEAMEDAIDALDTYIDAACVTSRLNTEKQLHIFRQANAIKKICHECRNVAHKQLARAEEKSRVYGVVSGIAAKMRDDFIVREHEQLDAKRAMRAALNKEIEMRGKQKAAHQNVMLELRQRHDERARQAEKKQQEEVARKKKEARLKQKQENKEKDRLAQMAAKEKKQAKEAVASSAVQPIIKKSVLSLTSEEAVVRLDAVRSTFNRLMNISKPMLPDMIAGIKAQQECTQILDVADVYAPVMDECKQFVQEALRGKKTVQEIHNAYAVYVHAANKQFMLTVDVALLGLQKGTALSILRKDLRHGIVHAGKVAERYAATAACASQEEFVTHVTQKSLSYAITQARLADVRQALTSHRKAKKLSKKQGDAV